MSSSGSGLQPEGAASSSEKPSSSFQEASRTASSSAAASNSAAASSSAADSSSRIQPREPLEASEQMFEENGGGSDRRLDPRYHSSSDKEKVLSVVRSHFYSKYALGYNAK